MARRTRRPSYCIGLRRYSSTVGDRPLQDPTSASVPLEGSPGASVPPTSPTQPDELPAVRSTAAPTPGARKESPSAPTEAPGEPSVPIAAPSPWGGSLGVCYQHWGKEIAGTVGPRAQIERAITHDWSGVVSVSWLWGTSSAGRLSASEGSLSAGVGYDIFDVWSVGLAGAVTVLALSTAQPNPTRAYEVLPALDVTTQLRLPAPEWGAYLEAGIRAVPVSREVRLDEAPALHVPEVRALGEHWRDVYPTMKKVTCTLPKPHASGNGIVRRVHMAKPITSIPLFVLSVLPLALVACGQSVTDLDARGVSGQLVEPDDSTEEDARATDAVDEEDAGATDVAETAPTGVNEVTNSPSTSPTGVEPLDAGQPTGIIDPRPEKPARGTVPGGATDFSETGCCSRVSGSPISQFCPVGTGSTTFGTLKETSDKLQAAPSAATVGVPFELSLARLLDDASEFAVEETTIDPPSGIVDLSPVFWVWTAFVTDTPLNVRVPTSNKGFSAAAGALHLFFSPDGREFTQLADDYANAGFLQGTLPGPGFVVAGAADPTGIQCSD